MKQLLTIAIYLISAISILSQERLNIVNILVDDMGYSDIACYGGEIDTPNINSLAEGGLRFSSYRTYPKCGPTRTAMLMGVESETSSANAISFTEALKSSGYQCYHVGKLHGPLKDKEETLHEYGFDRSFGNTAGGNFFDHTLNQCYLDGKKWHTDKEFYKTDVQTDFALEFLESNKSTNKPFYLQLWYHAPHFPIQTKPKDIAKYKGMYSELPEFYRKQRFERQKEMGLVKNSWKLPPSHDSENEYAKLSQEDREKYALVLQTYAGMLDCVDQNIGRVIAKLKEMGVYENTMIIFSSDNGSTVECGQSGKFPGTMKERFGKKYDENAPVGSRNAHWGIGGIWANVANTPYSKFKMWCHEGGISSPLIIHLPGKIKNPGSIDHTNVFVWDFFPTFLEIAKTSLPDKHEKRNPQKLIGDSLLPLILNGKLGKQDRKAYFTMGKSSCFIKGNWKIVRARDKTVDPETVPWELYNLSEDRTEVNNLVSTMPEKLQEMTAAYKTHLETNNITKKQPKNLKKSSKKKSKKSKK